MRNKRKPTRSNPVRAAAVSLLLCAASIAAAGEGTLAARHGAREDARITSADGISLFVRQYGEGKTPIVLLTGGPGYSGDYLEEMAVRFSARYRVLLPDQRGTGRSVINPWDASRLTIEASVGDVEALRVQSGAEQIILVGHSWGGVLSMAYAAKHADHVHALVLIGSGGATSDWQAEYARNMFARLEPEDIKAVFQAQARMAKDPDGAIVGVIRATAPAMIVDRELAIRMVDEYVGPAMLTPAVTLAMQGWLMQYDLGDGLRDVQAPVMVIQGEHDPIGAKTARDIAGTFARGEVHFIPNAAHEPYMEQPGAFYGIVEPFLRRYVAELDKE